MAWYTPANYFVCLAHLGMLHLGGVYCDRLTTM
jgi:hypothetical protein